MALEADWVWEDKVPGAEWEWESQANALGPPIGMAAVMNGSSSRQCLKLDMNNEVKNEMTATFKDKSCGGEETALCEILPKNCE